MLTDKDKLGICADTLIQICNDIGEYVIPAYGNSKLFKVQCNYQLKSLNAISTELLRLHGVFKKDGDETSCIVAETLGKLALQRSSFLIALSSSSSSEEEKQKIIKTIEEETEKEKIIKEISKIKNSD